MDGDVEGSRTAVAVAPQARTRRTQAAVVAAARRLFLERGYAATTIEAISELSDTPQPTVYRLFSSKLGILKAVLDVSIAGDDEAVAMADRPQGRSLVANPDPRDTLTGFAALVRGPVAHTAPVHRVLEGAAPGAERQRPGAGGVEGPHATGPQRVHLLGPRRQTAPDPGTPHPPDPRGTRRRTAPTLLQAPRAQRQVARHLT